MQSNKLLQPSVGADLSALGGCDDACIIASPVDLPVVYFRLLSYVLSVTG